MRRRPSSDHQEAVARRLALLSAELAAVRGSAVEERAVEERATEEWDDESRPGDEQHDWTAEHTRIATRPRAPLYAVPPPTVLPPTPPETPVAPSPAPAIPVPGRHAARRPGSVLVDVVPETLRGRAWLGPSQVAVLAVLVALGLAVTSWWVLRGRPQQVTTPVTAGRASPLAAVPSGAPAPNGEQQASGAVSPVAASASGPTGTVTVDVEGKVAHPGIVVLDAGARVVDALERAGGARPRADLTGLNLARVLVDGEQVLVGVPGAAAAAPAGPSPPAAGAPGAPLVNLNTAGEAELEALPEVGPVTAQSILTWRDEHGGFSSVDELLEVDGIGDATLSKLAPLVTV